MTNNTSSSNFNNTQLQNKIKCLLWGNYYNNPHLFSRVTSDETYLISFPRAGSSWLRFLLTSLSQGEKATRDSVNITIPDANSYKLNKKSKPTPKPLVIKSHTPFIKIPAKVIYLVRDGRDALLSYYYQRLKRGKLKPEASPLDFYFDENLWPCPWHTHIADWLDGLETWPVERYKIVRYEDLVESTAEQMSAIAEFIGLSVTDRDLEKAISLNPKKQSEETGEPKDNQDKQNFLVNVEKPKKWQAFLSGEHLAKYEALAGTELQRLGYPLISFK